MSAERRSTRKFTGIPVPSTPTRKLQHTPSKLNSRHNTPSKPGFSDSESELQSESNDRETSKENTDCRQLRPIRSTTPSKSQTSDKNAPRNKITNSRRITPSKLITPTRATTKNPRVLKTGLTIDTSTPIRAQTDSDEDLDHAELEIKQGIAYAKEVQSTPGRDLYTFQRKRDSLEKFLKQTVISPVSKKASSKAASQLLRRPRTPFAERAAKRRVADRRTRSVTQALSSGGSSDSSSSSSSSSPAAILSLEQGLARDQFLQHLHSKPITSNNTLAKLPVLTQREYFSKLKQAPQHLQELKALETRNLQYFEQFIFEMEQGFDPILYGVGSKQSLLSLFIATHLCHLPVVEVHGYTPNVSIRTILRTLLDLLEHQGAIGTTQDQIRLIAQHMDERNCEIAIVVHSIDGPSLRNEKTQSALASLAAIHGVKFVCSMDQINASLLWDSHKQQQFNFVYHEATTFASFDRETSFENRMIKSETLKTISGCIIVLQTLSETAKNIFVLLLDHQLEQDLGLVYSDYYRQCLESFLCSNDLAFKTILTEFKDHELVVEKRNAEEQQVLTIPFSKEQLRDLAEQLA